MTITNDVKETLRMVDSVVSPFVNVMESPYFDSAESLKIWLISNKSGFLVIKGLQISKRSSAVNQVLINAIEKRVVRFKDKEIEINPTFFLLLEPSNFQGNGREGDSPIGNNLPASFLDAVDLCLDCTVGASGPVKSGNIEDVVSVNALADMYNGVFYDQQSARIAQVTKPESNDRNGDGYSSPKMNLS